MWSKTNYRQQNRQPIDLPADSKEYKRVKYSLKMALRMINGTFEDFKVEQFGQSGINFEDDHDKTTVESWYKPALEVGPKFDTEQNIYKNQGMIFAGEDHAEFKVGSIISNANEIETNRSYTYFLFKVTIGRAYVRPVNESNRDQEAKKPPLEDYDSVFL